MRKPDNSQDQNASAPSPTHARPRRLSEDDVQLVWECMAGIYGQLWSAPHGSDLTVGDALVWADGLAGLTRTQLHHGLNACMHSANNFPPVLGQFRALCLGSSDAPTTPLTQDQRLLRDREERAADVAHFKKMRELATGLGLDLWAHEAEHGIPHRTRPKYGPSDFGRRSATDLGKFLRSFGTVP